MKVRIVAYVATYNVQHREPGQQVGPITRTYEKILRVMLGYFHNAKNGECFPSYSAIAAKAPCGTTSVREAIKALEDAGILTWFHTIYRQASGLLRGPNVYRFFDPHPNAQSAKPPQSEFRGGNPGFKNLEIKQSTAGTLTTATNPVDSTVAKDSPVEAALRRLAAARAEHAGSLPD